MIANSRVTALISLKYVSQVVQYLDVYAFFLFNLFSNIGKKQAEW